MSSNKGEHVPLSVLLKRELASEKVDRPDIVSGQANQSKKGEDFTLIKSECQRVLGDGVTTYSVFGVCHISYVLFNEIRHIWFLVILRFV